VADSEAPPEAVILTVKVVLMGLESRDGKTWFLRVDGGFAEAASLELRDAACDAATQAIAGVWGRTLRQGPA